MKLLEIMFRNRCWTTTFDTITTGDADGWCRKHLVEAPQSIYLSINQSTEPPVSIAVYASDERGHGLIGTPGLHLEVSSFAIATPGTLELVGGSRVVFEPPLALKQRLRLDVVSFLLPSIARHVIRRHREYGFGCYCSEQYTPPEIRVPLIFDVEHDGPATIPAQRSKSLLCSLQHAGVVEAFKREIARLPPFND
jgi:hypothetical protein